MNELKPEKWIDEYGDYLFRHARSRVSEVEVAEDLVQETFLNAYKARHNFEGKASEKTWLVSILKNKIIDHYRKTLIKNPDQQGRKEVPVSFFSADGTWDLDHTGNDWKIDASSELESKEFFQIFNKCVSGIHGKSGEAFVLKYLDGEKSDDICKAMNISPSNYWVLIHRAKLKLRECLDKNWFSNL